MFRLDNGLKVILVRDPSAPVFAYQTWFAVGSRHEREGITGIAHLFEHLMFNQTENHPPGEFDRLHRDGGRRHQRGHLGRLDLLPRQSAARPSSTLAVELEADRMAHLTLGEKQVESEREVVANERRFRVEDDVDGFLNEELYKAAFTTHPYHWPTIGWMRDIEAISIDDCRTFYRTYYAPNNATVVLVGDVDEDARAGADRASTTARFRRQQIPADARRARAGADRASGAQSWPKPVTADKLRIGYKAPAIGHADYARARGGRARSCSAATRRGCYRRLVVETRDRRVGARVDGAVPRSGAVRDRGQHAARARAPPRRRPSIYDELDAARRAAARAARARHGARRAC